MEPGFNLRDEINLSAQPFLQKGLGISPSQERDVIKGAFVG